MAERVYFDTSALAKWYLEEFGSDDVETFLKGQSSVAISTLTMVEMRSLLARRRREGVLGAEQERKAFTTFEEDVHRRHLIRHPVDDQSVEGAVRILSLLPEIPLKTLDALHLSIVREIGVRVLATADRVMADAARELEMEVVWFGR